VWCAAAKRVRRRVWPGRRRELVTALKEADQTTVTLSIYWNRGIEEVRGVLDAGDVDGGVVYVRPAEMTVGHRLYDAGELPGRVRDIRWVLADDRRWGPF
jgi:hypothetical protein